MDKLETSNTPHDRSLCVGVPAFAVVGRSRAALYAARSLAQFGACITGAATLEAARAIQPACLAIIVAADVVPTDEHDTKGDGPTLIRLWEFEVSQPGVGDFASAVSGVSAVIGKSEGQPVALPSHVPEKWVGMYGASLALSLALQSRPGANTRPRVIDVSAADILRAFAEQNSGNHAGVPYGWRRNGRTAVEHGGVFPQGFFRCKDGYMAIQARSRQDWQGILAALDQPAWSKEKEFQNPFKLSEDDSRILPLLDGELMRFERSQLLERALACGAPMAPVMTLQEAAQSNLFRAGFMNTNGDLNSSFVVRRANAKGSET